LLRQSLNCAICRRAIGTDRAGDMCLRDLRKAPPASRQWVRRPARTRLIGIVALPRSRYLILRLPADCLPRSVIIS
jgi:hypothetical protein